MIEGDIAVNAENVILQIMTINGNLLLAENISQGEVTLKNSTPKYEYVTRCNSTQSRSDPRE